MVETSSVNGDGLTPPARLKAMMAIVATVGMVSLDGQIANVALPTMARQLDISAAASVWIVNIYQFGVTICLLGVASLSEVIGCRRVYLCGVAIFVAGSAACAASTSFAVLLAGRAVQAAGGACIMATNSAIIRFIYPRHLLGRGIGVTALIVAGAAACGPSVAAVILSVGSWPWLFIINLPIGLLALLIARATLPRTPTVRRPFDIMAALMSAAVLGALIAALRGLGHNGSRAWSVAGLLGALVMLDLLVRRERGQEHPLIPVDLLSIPIFSLSLCTSVLSFAAQMLALIALPFLLQFELGYSVIATGGMITFWPLATAASALLAGRLADRYPAGLLGGVGMLMFAAGVTCLSFIGQGATHVDVAWRLVLTGFGFGQFQSPNNRVLIGSAPPHRAGSAGGMLATARLVGQTFGATLAALALEASSAAGPYNALYLSAACAAAAAAMSVSRLAGDRPARHASQRRADDD